MLKRWGVLWIALACCSLMTAAQQSTTDHPAARTPAATISFDVLVTDPSGNPVTGLQEKDFTVLDNGSPAPIQSFAAYDSSTAGPPESVIVLIDDVNTDSVDLMYAWKQIGEFLTMHGGHLPAPVSLLLLTDSNLKRLAGPSQDGALLKSEMGKMPGMIQALPQGDRNNAADRMEISLKALMVLGAIEARKPGRKLVIWIGPGWWMFDNGSVLEWNEQQKSIFQTIMVTSQVLRAVHITIDSVDPLGSDKADAMHTYLWKSHLKPVTKWQEAKPADLALQVLAAQSGGRMVWGSNNVAEELDACLEDARAWYTVTVPVPSDAALNSWQGVEVNVDRPGAKVRTQNGYYAVPAK
ncbi:MAG: VWA domain-containing protein [Acidobacteriaceae bacterium]